MPKRPDKLFLDQQIAIPVVSIVVTDPYSASSQQCWGLMSLVVQTQIDPAAMTRAIRNELNTIDKDQPIENVRTMTQLVSRSVAQRRLSVQILSGFAGLAMLLAAIGLYGVLAYNVAQRKREIGVRMALGALRSDGLSLVVGSGLKLTLAGLGLGLLAALALIRVMGSLLYEVKPSDPITYLGVSGLSLAVGLFACWLPARRATRVEPMEALRYE